MFLPLGFGGRFPRFPWVTTTLCLVIFLVHNFYGRTTMERVEAAYMNVYYKTVLHPKYPSIVARFCETKALPPGLDADLREAFSDVAKSECVPGNELEANIGKFVKEHTEFNTAFVLRAVLPYGAFFGLEKEMDRGLAQIKNLQRETGLYTADNRGSFPLVMSQFLHADWTHLLGNLLVLFLVGCLVECRRSPWIMLGTFFVGGSLGFVLHASFANAGNLSSLVGASAGIAAVSGLFTAFFFRFRMKFVFFVLPPFYKTFHASSIVILPLTFYASDVLNSISHGVDSSVAHVAHLGGSLFGLLLGLSFEKLRPIRWPLLYGFEDAELNGIESESNPYERIHRALALLKVNPENMLASQIVCEDTLRLIGQGYPVTPEFSEFLRQHVPTLMSVYKRLKNHNKAFELLPQIPMQVSFASILDRSSQSVIVAGMKWAQGRGDSWTLLRLYETWATRYAGHKRQIVALSDVGSIIEALEKSPENYRKLSQLYHTSPQGPLAAIYHQGLVSMFQVLNKNHLEKDEAA
jgi:membrane associated rhomboid family serine protease